MTEPLEDRLRAHFAERTEREPLPGPDPEDALARTLDVASRRRWRATSSNGRRNHLFLAAAAAAVLALGTVAFVVTRDDSDEVHTVDDPRPTTTTTDTTTPEPSEPTGDASTTTSSSTTSTSAPPATSDTVTVVVGVDGVLGWWDGSAWVQAEADSQIPVEGGAEYQILRVGSAEPRVGGPPGDVECVEGGGNATIDVGIDYPADILAERPPIAVTGVPQPLVRPVQALDPNNGDYQTAASQVLTDLGIEDPDPPVVQAVRSDLDGDGTDEVLLVAERRAVSEPYLQGTAGDYSVVMLRRVVDGQVQTTVVRQWITSADVVPYVESFRVSAVGDLNGDDHMEVVVDTHAYEGHSSSVYEMQGTTLTSVLTVGCGA